MSGDDFFNIFFGNRHGGNGRPPESEGDDNFGFNKPNARNWSPNVEDDDMKHFTSTFNFMGKDPFEMHHRFFEEVNEMISSLMPPEVLHGFQGKGVFDPPGIPAITEKQDPRDHYLKPGVKTTPSEESGGEKSRIVPLWLDKFIGSRDQDDKSTKRFFSFKSVTRTTVTLPDGTVKTEEISRNPDGTEERIVSFSKPDGNSSPPFDSHLVGPDYSGLLGAPKKPEYKSPRYELLKPGYEKFNPHSEKIDKDLDKQIEQAGIESLPPFTKEIEFPQPKRSVLFRSAERRIVTLPNGVVESEEIIRNPDGTKQRTVTHAWPDGTTKNVTISSTDSLLTGYGNPVLSVAREGFHHIRDFIDTMFK